MAKSKLIEQLKRPIVSLRCDSFIEACAAFTGCALFVISGLFMMLWGNLSGDLWPIPKEPAPFWLRLPIGIVLIIVSVYFLRAGRTAIQKMKKQRSPN